MKLIFSCAMTLLVSQTAIAGQKQEPASEIPKDVFYQTASNKGTNVEFDCAPKTSKSPYCLIQIVDPVKHVVCYGLTSSDKVVNPTVSCVNMPAVSQRVPTSTDSPAK